MMEKNQKIDVGAILRRIRTQNNWSQMQLAAAAGMHAVSVYNAEKNENIRLSTLEKLSKGMQKLGVHITPSELIKLAEIESVNKETTIQQSQSTTSLQDTTV